MLREMNFWLKVVMHNQISSLNYTDITYDSVCLVYDLMTVTQLNIGAIVKYVMRKARVDKGHKYDFSGLIT